VPNVKGVKKTPYRGALCFVLPTKYYSGDQIKMTEMGKACGMYRRKKTSTQGFGGETERMEG
jgi:hypothetical protein